MADYDKEKEKAAQREMQYQQVLDQLRSDERLKDAFKDYDEESVETFLKDCANQKVRVLEYGPRYKEWQEKAERKWHDKAHEAFAQIQHKKLFDLQCQWRAEQVQLDGICIGADFLRYEHNVLNCPFIEPVSPEDIELYCQFMQSPDFTHQVPFMQLWQDYDTLLGEMSGFLPISFPEWYDFHNSRTGKGFYIQLPDTRGEKEHHYLVLASRERNRKAEDQNTAVSPTPAKDETAGDATESGAKPTSRSTDDSPAAKPAAQQQPDKRPRLDYYNNDVIKRFVKTYEDDETKNYYWKYTSYLRKDKDDRYGTADEIVRELSKHMEVFPMEANDDWYEALYETLHTYKLKKTLDAVSAAYGQYMLYVNAGIQFPSEGRNDMFAGIADERRKLILQGRVAAGEAEDFDF